MSRRLLGKIVPVLVALALLPAFGKIQFEINDERFADNLTEPFQLSMVRDLPLAKITGTLFTGVLSGFRGMVVDILWMKTDSAWDEGRDDLVVPLLNAINMLDPRFIDAWELLGWHQAYNLHAKEVNKYGQWDWSVRVKPIQDGLNTLERGIRWNPTRAQLYWFIGVVYFEKWGDFEKAAEWWQKAFECPDRPNYAARFIAHAYELLPDFDKSLYWYYVADQDLPNHPTPPGAVITIRERYLPAWNAYKRGDLAEARRLIEQTLNDYRPSDKIALHFLAKIMEEQGNLKEAIKEWEVAFAVNKSDATALRKAWEIRDKAGMPHPTSKELEDEYFVIGATPKF